MRRLGTLCRRTAPVLLLVLVWLSAARAKADITLFDNDGWTFRTTGLVAAHYQLIKGDADPLGSGKQLVGGRLLDEKDPADARDNPPSLTMSDVRSGFIGTQIGFELSRQISPTVHVDSLLAASVNGINSNRGQDYAAPKGVDYREAWAQVVSPYGTLKFGRMFGLFASSSAAVQVMAWQYGVGHPCVVDASTISCGSSGAGPLYPGFDAAFRYISPRFFGLQFQLSVSDPNVGTLAKMSPYPRVDTELNFDMTFGPARVRAFAQTMYDRIYNATNPDPVTNAIRAVNIWGVMGTGLLDIGPVSVGGGGWTGAGVGERIPLEAADAAHPIYADTSNVLRNFLGLYGNAQMRFGANALTVGGGELLVKLTDKDLSTMTDELVLKDQWEGHVTFNHKFADCIVLNVEYMHWHTDWQDDPSLVGTPGYSHFKQDINFAGGGLNYIW
jgi:predicted porin